MIHLAEPKSYEEEQFHGVVQNISHCDPAAERDPHLLELQADDDWATLVEMRLHSPPRHDDDTPDEHESNIFILQFKAHPHEFYEALVSGLPLRACREALHAAGRHCVLPVSGAKLFIKPEQWDEVMERLRGRALHPYHVIVAAEYEQALAESLQTIPYRRRPKLKPGVARTMLNTGYTSPLTKEEGFDVDDDVIVTLECTRTFLCCVRQIRDASSVVQSTVNHYRGTTNPRRYDS